MSRIGKKIIDIPQGVEVNVTGTELTVKGPKGELKQEIHPHVSYDIKDKEISINVKNPEVKGDRSLWGLFGSLTRNMIEGVTQGFQRKLEVNGVGFRVALSGNKLVLNLGFSHPVEYILPKGVSGEVDKNVIILSSIDKQLIGETAAQIRRIKKPEPYKGKGIKYAEEIIKKKLGKTAAKSAG